MPQQKKHNVWQFFSLLAMVLIGLLVLAYFLSSLLPSIGIGRCVAVIEIKDELISYDIEGSFLTQPVYGSETIAETIEKLDYDEEVGAVVLVIDSPGGSVLASREIYDSVVSLQKPVVAYMRESATSGAYYVAAGADYIVAEQDTITGSIGVITTSIELSELFDQLGINITTFTSDKYKDIGSYTRAMTEEEKEIIMGIINEIFEDFKQVVLERREGKLDENKIEEIFDGRIMTGKQALNYGLVDELGNRDVAIKKASELGNITEEEPVICEVSIGENGGVGLFNVKSMFASFGYLVDNYLLKQSKTSFDFY